MCWHPTHTSGCPALGTQLPAPLLLLPGTSRGCLSPLLLHLHVLSPELGEPRSPCCREEAEGCVPKATDKPTPKPGRAPRAGAGSHRNPNPEKPPLPAGTRPAFPTPDVILSFCSLVLPHSPSSWILGMTQGPRLLLRAGFAPLAQLEMWHRRPWT